MVVLSEVGGVHQDKEIVVDLQQDQQVVGVVVGTVRVAVQQTTLEGRVVRDLLHP
jgi:hypothetical protein